MVAFFLLSIFRLYPGSKLSFEYNGAPKSLFLRASFCWDSRLSLDEMDQKPIFGGSIGCGDSYLELLFRHFKVFRLYEILHDAARAVRAHCRKGPGYRYRVRRKQKSRLLGHLTGLIYCLFVKHFLPSAFNFCRFLKPYDLHCTRY